MDADPLGHGVSVTAAGDICLPQAIMAPHLQSPKEALYKTQALRHYRQKPHAKSAYA
jgi:hypothetical protein